MTDENEFKRVKWAGDEPHESDDDGPDGMPLRPSGTGLSAEDLELLTLAARAIGAERVEVVEGEQWVILHFADGTVLHGWNPLQFKGDAFELQVKFRLNVRSGINHVAVESDRDEILVQEWWADQPDNFAAACRAVTRAVAEIGRAMA